MPVLHSPGSRKASDLSWWAPLQRPFCSLDLLRLCRCPCMCLSGRSLPGCALIHMPPRLQQQPRYYMGAHRPGGFTCRSMNLKPEACGSGARNTHMVRAGPPAPLQIEQHHLRASRLRARGAHSGLRSICELVFGHLACCLCLGLCHSLCPGALATQCTQVSSAIAARAVLFVGSKPASATAERQSEKC